MIKLLRRREAWWLLALLTVGVIAIFGAWLAHSTGDEWSDDFWFEVAKSGVQLVAVGVLGGALTAVWRTIAIQRELADKEIAEQRQRKIERNDKIRAELLSLVALYNDVKSVRRVLRSLGLDLKTYPEAERARARQTGLTSEQADGFRAQMLILSKLQLGFESKAKQFGQTDFLDGDTGLVLLLWEQNGWTIRKGTCLGQVSDGLVRLFRVRDHMRPEVSEPLREITPAHQQTRVR